MQQIVPNLWFDHNAQEAVDFYTSNFSNAKVLATRNYPTEGLPEFQQEWAGQVLTIDFELAGQHFTAINAGPEFSFTPAISFIVNFDPSSDAQARERLDGLWVALSDGGQVLMPLNAYPFSQRYGWVQDRYGLSWQLMLTDPDGAQRPSIVPSLMFGHTVQNRAREALEFYESVFPSRPGQVFPYAEPTGAAAEGAVMFGDIELAGLWVAVMDSTEPQQFTFNEAISFAVPCDGQAELDAVWEQLSHVPEAEVCGWCKDQFGVSWQVVPSNVDELLDRPGGYQHMMGMKKLIIDEF
jgi:predicted 3-demethylubiquinone-9 3-methyltransferase (glyoxalase superfamily)